MVKMKFFGVRKYLLFLFVCLACANVQAQTQDSRPDSLKIEDQYQDNEQDYLENEYIEEEYEEDDYNIWINLVALNLTSQIPLETFAKNVSGVSLGLGLSYYNNFSKKDDLFWAIHYSKFRIDRVSNTFFVQEQFVEYNLSSRTKTSLIFLGYGLRYYPDIYTPSIEPYLDVKLGGNVVYTFTSERINEAEDSDVTFNYSDLSFAYAIGAGIQYNVRQGQALHLSLNYQGGTSATYYISEEKGFEVPLDNFVRKTTQLDYLQILAGLTFGF